MEWCGKLYVSGSLEKFVRRFTEFLAAVLLLCLLLGEVDGVGNAALWDETAESGRTNENIYHTDISGAGAAEICGTGCKTAALHIYAAGTADLCTVLSGLAAGAAEEPETDPAVTDSVRFTAAGKGTEGISVSAPADGNRTSENSAAEILTAPETSVSLKEEADNIAVDVPEEIPEELPADPEDIPADPAAPSPSGPQAGTVIEGFLVDENGVVCGIADPGTAVKESRLVLPEEGCTAVAPGAFLSAPEGIREVYIPANITDIAEGAFAGLSQLEWFNAESSGSYVSADGVLFSDGGTCLLAFPPARTGIYRVPSGVVRFAADAFAGASIHKLDARGCMLEEVGNVPEEIEILQRL